MAYILHIDTSTQKGLVALTHQGQLVAKRINDDERDHATVINLNIEAVVKEAGFTMQQLDALAVIGGPGSYTGLRIGLATAKGLCYALQKPLILHNRLDLMCLQSINDNNSYDNYVAILPARQEEYFIAVYNKHKEPVRPAQHIHQKELEELLKQLEGKTTILGRVYTLETNNTEHVTADNFSSPIWYEKSYNDFLENNFADLASATPFYLKSVYTTQRKTT